MNVRQTTEPGTSEPLPPRPAFSAGWVTFTRTVRVSLDRGSDVLRVGLPVLTAEGVVGRVTRLYGDYSEVQLAVDPASSIDVVIGEDKTRGLLQGIEGADRYRAKVGYVMRDAEIRPGAIVRTSGAAGVFPPQLMVGRVTTVSKRKHGLYQHVEVVPAVNFATLRHVLVVLAPSPPKPERPSEAPIGIAQGWTP